jgi:flagellin
MPQIINTNIASMNAQRNLNGSQSALNVALQRLSSGLRINSAKDDAAGLAITERFTAQIRGLNQAARNANDGISLAQTAEGALGEVSNNLQRVRELAVQSANATNSASDRAALQAEVSQLVAEIDRVATQTMFNGVNLLDGTFSAQAFQVGANAGQTITISSIANARANVLGGTATTTYSTTTLAASAAPSAALVAGDLVINGTDIGAVARDAKLIADAINAQTGITSVTASASASSSGSLGAFSQVTGTTAGNATYTLQVAGVTLVNAVDPEVTTINATYIQNQITANAAALAAAGVTVSGTVAGNNLTFSKADGSNLTITETLGGNAAQGFTASLNGGTITSRGTITLTGTGANGITISGNNPSKAGAGITAGNSQIATATVNVSSAISTIDVSTAAGASAALSVVDNALSAVNSARASLGAVQNRFGSVVANVQTTAENLSASRSRVQDADFAAETASLTRAQILQQAGVAMLAQANALPNNVLALLRG